MQFEEINKRLDNHLVEQGITEFTSNQLKVIKQAKKGQNTLFKGVITPEIIQGLFFTAYMRAPEMLEGAPRVLWITDTPDRVDEYCKGFRTLLKRSDVTIEGASDKGKIIEQRNAIFEGTEILVGNPKRLLDLYNQNGFHCSKISLLLIDHLDSICKNPLILQAIRRLNESLPKCHKLFFTEGEHNKLHAFVEEICTFYEEIELLPHE